MVAQIPLVPAGIVNVIHDSRYLMINLIDRPALRRERMAHIVGRDFQKNCQSLGETGKGGRSKPFPGRSRFEAIKPGTKTNGLCPPLVILFIAAFKSGHSTVVYHDLNEEAS